MFTNQITEDYKNHKKGINRNTLKIIACATMLVDHIGDRFIVQYENIQLHNLTQFIGYVAAPLFFFFIVEGYHHTRNANKYTRNLLIFAIVSYLPYIIFFFGSVNSETVFELNIMYTLLIGLLVIRVRHEVKSLWLKIILIVLLFCVSTAGDWSYSAPLIILTFDVFYDNRKQQVFAYALIAMLRDGAIIVTLLFPFMDFFNSSCLTFNLHLDTLTNIWQNLGLFIPIILILLYNGEKGKSYTGSKWGFYLFYPVHITILAIVKYVIL
jgi:hypothetical protein